MDEELKVFIVCLVIPAVGVGGYILGTALWDYFYGGKRNHGNDNHEDD